MPAVVKLHGTVLGAAELFATTVSHIVADASPCLVTTEPPGAVHITAAFF
jgi:hypothetical protein